MQSEQLKQRIARVEQSADEARSACQKASFVPEDLKQAVLTLHEQASAAKHATQGQESASEDSLRKDVMQLEQTADRAMQACRMARDKMDPQLQQAIENAHREASALKHEMTQAA